MKACQDQRIKAARHFGMLAWPSIRHSALKWVMCEMQKIPSFRDREKIDKVCRRFKVGAAVSYYVSEPEMYWD